ncbi:TetR/AcrR family transcriptional regulator [Nocardia suismassiliense]|uniref:TetR/AcrR family transcriptional regulator n=1 Tax=Nocardia suismassiliense TaxID=2077092 RepID=A0ABW6R1Q9_9NOCA
MVVAERAKTERMPRAQRREQILAAATRAFARGGFAATGLDAVAAEAGVTHVILYRHFASKADLYQAVLDRTHARLAEHVGTDDFDDGSIPALLRAAEGDPDGFRLLFRHAAREPEFREQIDTLRARSIEIAEHQLAEQIPDIDPSWRNWAARLLPTVTLEAVIAWLDAGRPDPDRAAERIQRAVDGVIQAAREN